MRGENLKGVEFGRKSRKTELYIELGLIFMFGFFVGIAIKNEAEKKVTIGFEDYKMKMQPRSFLLNRMQDEIMSQQLEGNR